MKAYLIFKNAMDKVIWGFILIFFILPVKSKLQNIRLYFTLSIYFNFIIYGTLFNRLANAKTFRQVQWSIVWWSQRTCSIIFWYPMRVFRALVNRVTTLCYMMKIIFKWMIFPCCPTICIHFFLVYILVVNLKALC